MIYLFDKPETVDSIEPLLPFLPDFRIKKALSYRFIKDARQSALAYLLLRYALWEYGILEPGPFNYGEHGKPTLRQYPNIHFNLSHCDSGVCCIVESQEVGIDIEQIDRFDYAVAERVCSAEELRFIEQSEYKEKAFCRIWTQKESYLKLNGQGICVDLRQLCPKGSFFFYEGNGYLLCAIGQTSPELQVITDVRILC